MDFSPYQSSPPEHGRVASPEYNQTRSPRASLETAIAGRGAQNPNRAYSPSVNPTNTKSPPPLQHPQPQRGWSGFEGQSSGWGGAGAREEHSMPGAYPAAEVSEFDTSLGLRLDHEACLAYLALPPLGAIVLLILERNSDYVRFHAWQSALVFTSALILHLIFSWSSFLSWLFFIGDVALIALLTFRAYQDAEILDRFEIPFFGRMASRFLDDE